MKIEEIIAAKRSEVAKYAREERRYREAIESILAEAERSGAKALTESQDAQAEILFDKLERAKAACEKASDALKRAEAVKAETDEEEKRFAEVHTVAARRSGGSDGAYSVGQRVSRDGAEVTMVQGDGNPWRNRASGQVATVERGQSFADHEVVKREAAKYGERDRILVGTHGEFAQQIRAMTDTSGSAIVPMVWSNEIIDLARNAAVCLQAGVQVVPMDALTVQIGRLTTDPSPAFKTEGSPVSSADMAYDYIQLKANTLSALVVVSMEFLQDAPNASSSIQNALGTRMALEIDKSILFGQLGATGTNDEGAAYGLAAPYPMGILKNLNTNYTAGVIGSFPTNGTAQTAATPWTEMLSVYYNPLRQNERVTAIISNVALKQQYAGMYDSMYNPIRMPDSLAQVPWLTTNAIPSFTRGTMTSRATDVFAGDFSQVLLGQRMDLTIQVLTERYAENGQVGILAYWRGDVAVARPKALACYRGLQGAL